ncbi:MAG: radical SAM family heme chaperone HemW, partial [Bacteroidales bacterium]
EDIHKILQAIDRQFSVNHDNVEITVEANPDDLTAGYLKNLRASGVNRISLGIQSFSSQDLDYLERLHEVNNIPSVMNHISRAGFNTISADLIYGIPTQTEQVLYGNIQELMRYPVDHISAYALTVEPNTILHWQIKHLRKSAIDEALASSHFLHVSEHLEDQGFEHYEISNYALPGKYSRHNINYWYQKPYLGIGPSAHSYDGCSRQWNISATGPYIKAVKAGYIPAEKEILSTEQQFNEFIMLRLRTRRGIDMQEVARRFGSARHNALRRAFKKLRRPGLITFDKNTIFLTRKGFLYADGLAAELFID